jgi:hypothetical protein
MPKTTTLPTLATLSRFSIDLENMPKGLEIWTLDFPFDREIWQYKTKVEQGLRSRGERDEISVPYRQLNNALMAVSPTLTHGFEWVQGRGRLAMAVGTPASPARLPEPEDIRHIIREWAGWWMERPYIQEEILAEEWATMRKGLMTAINAPLPKWLWRQVPVEALLRSFDPNESLNYQALPSLFAALLDGKTLVLGGTPIQWRKVQDANSKKLSLVGFTAGSPIWTSYRVKDYRKSKAGEGFFAYKLEFNLQTQAGRSDPWLFLSLHIQRYGSEALTRDNQPRRIAILSAANRARLDNFPVDSTLAKLQISGGIGDPRWDSDLAEILQRIGATALRNPADVLADPRRYWRSPDSRSNYVEDEYYVIHAEGYDYDDAGSGHQLEAGSSMVERAELFEAAAVEHLPMLVPDRPLQPDKPAPSGQKRPRAMRDFEFMSRTNLAPDEVENVVRRALRGEEILVAILWHHEDTLRGVREALCRAFQLQPGQPFPANVCLIDAYIEYALLEGLESEKGQFDKSRHERIRGWRNFLQTNLPRHSNHFAIVELLDRKRSWQVKGAARTACAQEGITSQMVQPVRLREDSAGKVVYLGGRGRHRHRAESVAREIALRHIGGLYGHPQEVYQAAGVKEEELEVLALYLHTTKGNIRYPLAAKIAYDGAVEVLLPHRKEWLRYGNAAPVLGNLFASEWRNTRYRSGKREIMKWKKEESALWYDNMALSRFLLRVLKGLQKPTIAVIEADIWRRDGIWPQLRNPDLPKKWRTLDFSPHDRVYERDDPQFANLLGIIRMRTEDETPQYFTDTRRGFSQLAGFVDNATGDLLHYFSIGGRLVTAKGQDRPPTRYATMLDETGAGVPYKYPQVVELVPFFVRSDYQTEEGLVQLCRVPHYLRVSPAWPQGNITQLYPMHLARQLVEDQLCILGMED